MDEQVKKLQYERLQMYTDLYNNKLPKRIPVELELPHSFVAEYSQMDYKEFQYNNYAFNDEKVIELCGKLFTDSCPVQATRMIGHRPPSFYQTLGSQSFVMGDSGFVQHPEVKGMNDDEYDELISDPLAFMTEKVIPRQYKALENKSALEAFTLIEIAKSSLAKDSEVSSKTIAKLFDKFGYYTGAPAGSGGFIEAPFDFLADLLRGFSGITMDIRRKREKVKTACEALKPYMYYWGLPSAPDPRGSVYFPLHMPTFMREKDFAELWLPSFKDILETFASQGVRSFIFCEDDWMRYIDYIQELPAGTVLQFEYGDPQILKEKLGKKFILNSLFKSEYTRMGSPDRCVDEVKKFLDIMLPGGGYTFGLDKGPLMASDIKFDNYIALADTLHNYAVYDNAGESYGTPLNSENFTYDISRIGKIESKCLFNFEEYQKNYPMVPDFAKANFENYSLDVVKFYLSLLV